MVVATQMGDCSINSNKDDSWSRAKSENANNIINIYAD